MQPHAPLAGYSRCDQTPDVRADWYFTETDYARFGHRLRGAHVLGQAAGHLLEEAADLPLRSWAQLAEPARRAVTLRHEQAMHVRRPPCVRRPAPQRSPP